MKKPLTLAAFVLGIIFIAIAIYYWTVPAGSLPSFVPGYAAGSTQIHFKHGLASLILALGLFVYAWFASAPAKRLPNN